MLGKKFLLVAITILAVSVNGFCADFPQWHVDFTGDADGASPTLSAYVANTINTNPQQDASTAGIVKVWDSYTDTGTGITFGSDPNDGGYPGKVLELTDNAANGSIDFRFIADADECSSSICMVSLYTLLKSTGDSGIGAIDFKTSEGHILTGIMLDSRYDRVEVKRMSYVGDISETDVDSTLVGIGGFTPGKIVKIDLLLNMAATVKTITFYLDGREAYSFTMPDSLSGSGALVDFSRIDFGTATGGTVGWLIGGIKTAAPDPQACGDPGTVYLKGDLDENCKVNLGDFAIFAQGWPQCTDPADSNCDPYWE